MKFKSLEFYGAGPFKDPVKLDLSMRDKVLIVGDNGSGKTTIWNVLTHIMYGKAANDAKGNALIGADGVFYGKVEFTFKGHDYIIEQFRNHKRRGTGMEIQRVGDDKPVTPYKLTDAEKYVSDVLGYPRNHFLGAVFIPQRFVHVVVTGKPSERMNYVSDVFGLSLCDTVIGVMSTDLRNLNNDLRELDEIKAKLKEATELIEASQDMTDEIKSVQADLVKAKIRVKSARTVIGHIEQADRLHRMKSKMPPKPKTMDIAALDTLRAELTTMLHQQQRRESLERKLCDLQTGVVGRKLEQTIASHYHDLSGQWRRLMDDARTISLVGDVCQACLRPYPERDREATVLAISVRAADLRTRSLAVKHVYDKLRATNDARNKGNRVLDEIATLPDGASEDTQVHISKLDKDRDSIVKYKAAKRAVDALASTVPDDVPKQAPNLAKLETERDRLTEQLGTFKRQQTQHDTLTARIDTYNEQASELEPKAAKAAGIKLLIEIVKSVKTEQLRDIVDTMSTRLPVYVSRIVGKEVKYRVVESGRGGIEMAEERDGMDILFRYQSGGEVDGITIAMIHVIRDLTPNPTNLLILDEIGLGLDVKRKERLPELIASLPVESVFVMSHDETLLISDIWSAVYRVENGQIRMEQ